MIVIAFFFLLRPGEYAISQSESTPFELKDVQFFRGQLRLDIAVATEAEILSATFVSLTFDKQKNAVRGEVIGHAPSGAIDLCPVRAIARRVLHLRLHNAPPSTPLAHVYNEQNSIVPIKPKHITDAIRLAVQFLGLAGADGNFCFLNRKHSRGKEFIECQNDENNVKIVFYKK